MRQETFIVGRPSNQLFGMPKELFLIKKSMKLCHLTKDLMNWVKKKNLPVIKAIYHEGQPCNNLMTLWNALHSSYNSAENRPISTRFREGINQCSNIEWLPFTG